MSTGFWTGILWDHWGIAANLTRLDGEYDLNFLAETPGDAGYVLKAMRPDCDPGLVDMQVQVLDHISSQDPGLPVPQVIRNKANEPTIEVLDEDGQSRIVWVLERLPGICYAKSAPKSQDLIRNIGYTLGAIDKSLLSFSHPSLARSFKWDLVQAGWINDCLTSITDPGRRAILDEIIVDFGQIEPDLASLARQPIHNDVNDYNILVAGSLSQPKTVSGLIDLGDMCAAPRICDLAIAAAYIVLDHPRPERALTALVAGYHQVNPLTCTELDLLWPLLRMRLAVSVVNSTLESRTNPDDPYVVISQAPAWAFLENRSLDFDLLRARLRVACGMPVVEGADRVLAHLDRQRGTFAPLLGQDLSSAPLGSLSVEHSTWPQNPFDMRSQEAARIGEEFENRGRPWLGYYNEPRLIYAEPAFRNGPWKASDRRTVHLAVDVFAPAGTSLFAPLPGVVEAVENRNTHLDYGGLVILRHDTPDGDVFYTLYGHLDPECCDRLKPGDSIRQGAEFCRLGDADMNGGWAPHLHFQVALSTAGMQADWPGVADPDDMDLWGALCPNPAALLNLPDSRTHYLPTNKAQVLTDRQAHFANNLKLTYSDPVMLVRGWQHHMFDEWGRPYLDAYNNVPHVGHAHPRIQAVAADQLRRMNSNTRYLHPAQTALADKILSKLPDQFEVCFFVNSGSEANELALRLARSKTGHKGMITPDHGYHGNTTGAIDISAYKFNAKGGTGPSDWVELVEVADDYRGSFRRDDPNRARNFANLVDQALVALTNRKHGLAGFIAETFPSVGGQIIPPKGYLAAVYEKIRAAGGVCIADEVQTGLGRLGEFYFAFEHQNAVPDIVALGKPLGNGHPVAAVLTTRAIADSFAQGPEFFSTFGGSTLSCRIAKEVLDIVDDEGLQDNARLTGAYLIQGLQTIQSRHPMLGDVRGIGLFVGVELIRPDGSEATELCAFVKNRMRDHRILIGSEGPSDNILKIRPPLTFTPEDADMLLGALETTLMEAERMIP